MKDKVEDIVDVDETDDELDVLDAEEVLQE